jgi:hypothetical protein
MNRMKFWLIPIFLLSSTFFFAQIGMGEWRVHVPNRKALDILQSNDQLYCVFENGLFEYDPTANESRLWTAVSGLSDVKLTTVGQYPSKKAVFIGYENGNIDKLENNRITNIPAIRLAEIQGNKKINRFYSHGSFVYVATGFGIVKIDPVKNEVKDSYYPTINNASVNDIVIVGDTIFALTTNRLMKGLLSNIALADPSSWQTDSRLPNLSTTVHSYTHLKAVDQELFALKQNENYGSDSVFQLRYNGNVLVNNGPFDLQINSLNSTTDRLIVNTEGAIFIYKSDLTEDIVRSSFNLGTWISPVGSALISSDELWIADDQMGLRKVFGPYNVFNQSFEGPAKSSFFSMDWQDGRLAVVGGGISSISPTFSQSGLYLFEEEKWLLRDLNNTTAWAGQPIWDFVSVSINPKDKEQIAVGTYSELPLSILNENGQVAQVYKPDNSTLTPTAPGGDWTLISALNYDDKGNLWALNAYSDRPLNVLTKDGIWYNFDCGTAAKNRFSRKMVIDYNGNKWFALEGAGIYGYKDNGTIADPSDDDFVQLNTGENSGALPSNTVNALAVDFDNKIWIGTDNGFAVLYNSNGAFDASPGQYNAQRIKLEFEGNVEYVLGNTAITDIEVDGGNRKWIATANAGIVLLSADGLEIIEQHTTSNSPLISNNILDIKLDHSTGELYIITDLGLVSYRTNATYEDPEYSDVKIFPNPARPDFEGPITIQGIRYNSDVKITDVAGNLVYMTTSNGGTATWDGRTVKGEKVKTGVYLIWTAANDGKGRKVGKVLVVN